MGNRDDHQTARAWPMGVGCDPGSGALSSWSDLLGEVSRASNYYSFLIDFFLHHRDCIMPSYNSWRNHSWYWVFPSDASCQLHVLWHDGNHFYIDGTHIGVLKETNQVCLNGFLLHIESLGLELKVGVTLFLHQLSNELLEGQLDIRRSVVFWYLWISIEARTPGLYL